MKSNYNNNDLEKYQQVRKKVEKAENINKELLKFIDAYLLLNDKSRSTDRKEVEEAYTNFYTAVEVFNNALMKAYTSFEPYKSYIDLLDELQNTTMKKNKTLSVLEVLPHYEHYINTPVLINGSVNPVLKNQLHIITQSRIKQLLDLCRENEHLEFANLLYTVIRMSLNKASVTSTELQEILQKVKNIDPEGQIIKNPVEFYIGGLDGKPLFTREEYQSNTAKFCKHCGRLIKENENKCKGYNVCSFYYKRNELWYTEIELKDYEVIYTVSDEYYELVTLPNLFEQLVYDTLKATLPKHEFVIKLHPNIERLGDILVMSKRTGKVYLLDCKNYDNPSNLKKYILDNNGTYIKSLINANSSFVYVVPNQHMNANLLEYISKNKGINKYQYMIKNDLNIANWIIKEDAKKEANLLGGIYAE